jgi:hypothetical protein
MDMAHNDDSTWFCCTVQTMTRYSEKVQVMDTVEIRPTFKTEDQNEKVSYYLFSFTLDVTFI